jgi:hypothetical protein
MDPATALKSVRAKGKPGEVLVSFFGDNSYGWFHESSLMPFKANYSQNSSVHVSKSKVWRLTCGKCPVRILGFWSIAALLIQRRRGV